MELSLGELYEEYLEGLREPGWKRAKIGQYAMEMVKATVTGGVAEIQYLYTIVAMMTGQAAAARSQYIHGCDKRSVFDQMRKRSTELERLSEDDLENQFHEAGENATDEDYEVVYDCSLTMAAVYLIYLKRTLKRVGEN